MAGLINWRKVLPPGANPDTNHLFVGVDPTDCKLYIKDDTGLVTKYETTANVAAAISAALTSYDLSTVVDSKISSAISNLVNGAGNALDTLNELATALGNDPNFATTITSALALKAPIASPTFTGTVSGITKAMVGLGNVDNTSDANKPISTASQTALNLKYDASNPNGYETPSQLNTRDTNNRSRANHTGTQTASTISDFNEAAQDAVGGILTDSSSIDFTYNDAGNQITAVLTDTTVTPNTYGTANSVSQISVDQKGRITSAASVPISVPSTQVTGLGALATKNTVATADIDNLAITSAKIGDSQVTSLKIADDAIVTNRILSNSVTNLKLSDMGANTLKGNNTGAVADPIDLTVAQVKTMLAINNVDNTSDVNKPISTATQTALNLKYDASNPNSYQTAAQVTASIQAVVAAAPAALDTLNEIAAALGNDANFAATVTTNLSLKAPIANPTFTGTVNGITKAMVGLGNADNTSDVNKPVSTAQQTALNLKSNLAGGNTFTGNQFLGGTFVNIATAPLNMVNSAPGTALTQLNLVNTGGGGGAGSAIDFFTYDIAGGSAPGAKIAAIDDNFSAYIAFSTKVPGAAANAVAERMRIANSGEVTVGGVLGTALSNNPLSVNGNANGFLQSNVQNLNAGANASSDIVATANNGTDTNNFVNLGVNSSVYADPSFTINGPNDGYLYSQGGDLSIGTGAANRITFFTGGTLAANEVARITPTGQLAIGTQAPSAASILQVDSTTQGFLPPRMTSAQRLAIATPPAGLTVYDTTLGSLCSYTGTTWGFETNYNTTAIQTTTSNVYGNITEWVTASLEPGLYALRLRGVAQSTAAANGLGLRFQNGTATISSVNINWSFNQAVAGTDKDFEYNQIALADNVNSASVVTANADFAAHGDGVFRVSVAGTIAIQIRSENNGTGVSIRPNSTLIIKRVGA